jgi:hypothetical protein
MSWDVKFCFGVLSCGNGWEMQDDIGTESNSCSVFKYFLISLVCRSSVLCGVIMHTGNSPYITYTRLAVRPSFWMCFCFHCVSTRAGQPGSQLTMRSTIDTWLSNPTVPDKRNFRVQIVCTPLQRFVWPPDLRKFWHLSPQTSYWFRDINYIYNH